MSRTVLTPHKRERTTTTKRYASTHEIVRYYQRSVVSKPNTEQSYIAHQISPKDYYHDLFEEYSKKGLAKYNKQKAKLQQKQERDLFNFHTPPQETENPQFLMSKQIFDNLVTDWSKFDLETINPYELMVESKSHEQRVDAQRVISVIIKQEIGKNDIEKAFDYFRLLQTSYLPVDDDVYSLLRDRIQHAFAELIAAGGSKLPSLATLNIIMNYFTETDRLHDAFALVLSMKMAGIKPTEHTYTALLNACMRYEDTDDAMVAFDMMKADNIVLDYPVYDRLFQLCASNVYPLGTKTVLEELCKHYTLPTGQRWLLMTTMYITEFMRFAGMPPSERGRRGFVTGITIQTRLVFPPKTKNNRLLEPQLGPEKSNFMRSLVDCKYGLVPTTSTSTSTLPPLPLSVTNVPTETQKMPNIL